MGGQRKARGGGNSRTEENTDAGETDAGEGWIDQLERPGLTIGPYKLLQEIGEGGMGVVYMAEQFTPVHRRVALKVIKLGMDTRHVIARFEAERQALAMMDHPNIAKALDAGATDSGRPYFVMELVRGIPMTTYCDQNKLDTRARIELFVKVCRAVQHAHQKGIIHRDLKPSNIMITLHDGEPVPKVIDFGIAKATSQQQLTDKTLFTNFGQMVGTPNYVSPEQAEMSGMDVDTRSDIYSLGVVLYQLLTGRTPLAVETLNKATQQEMQRLIREKTPHKPSTLINELGEDATTVAESRSSETGKLGKLFKGDLDWIVMKCLEKDRTRRYETANALALDLERHLDNVAVLARPTSRMYKLQKFAQRNRAFFVSGLAMTLSLIAAAAFSTYQASRASREAAHARKAQRVAGEERNRAERHARGLAEEIRRTYFFSMLNAARELEAQNVGRFREIMAAQTKVAEMIEDDPRGWEWYYLQSEAQQQEALIHAHRSEVTAVEWSPDGRYIASAGADGELILWDALSRRQLQVLGRRPDAWRTLAWSPDSNQLAGSGDDPMIEVWEIAQRKSSRTLRGHTAAVRSLSWSPDGERLASAGGDRQLIAWDVAAETPAHSHATARPVAALAWHPRTEMVAYSFSDEQGKTFLWSLGSGSHAALTADTFRAGITALSWSGDGRLLAGSMGSQELRIWDVETGELSERRVHQGAVNSVAWHPDYDQIATVSADGSISIWELDREHLELFGKTEPLVTLIGSHSSITKVGWNPDGTHLVTGGKRGGIALWDPQRTGTGRRLVEQFPSWLTMISWSADSRKIATAGPEIAKVHVVDSSADPLSKKQLEDAEHLADLGEGVTSVMWHPSNPDLLTVGSIGKGLTVWDWSTRSLVNEGMVDAQNFLACWSPDGSRLISLLHSKPFLWDRESGEEIRPGLILPPERGGSRASATTAAWSPDGSMIVTGGLDRSLELWDGQTYAHLRTLDKGSETDGESLLDVEFSPDSGRIATGNSAGIVQVYSIDGERLHEARAHQGHVKSVSWRPQGDRIASAGQDGIIQLIDTETYDWALKIQGDANEVYQVHWSPDGQALAGTGYENSLRIWRALATEDLPSTEPLPRETGPR